MLTHSFLKLDPGKSYASLHTSKYNSIGVNESILPAGVDIENPQIVLFVLGHTSQFPKVVSQFEPLSVYPAIVLIP